MNDAVVDHLRELAALYCPRGGPADYQPPEVALRELLRSPSGSYQSGGRGLPSGSLPTRTRVVARSCAVRAELGPAL